MTATTTFRLALWREWRGRWALHGIAPALAAMLWALPDARVDGFGKWCLIVALILLLPAAAARGSATPDTFWRGLGGPWWARLAGTAAAALAPLALLGTVLLHPGVVVEREQFLAYALAAAYLWITLWAARSATSGLRVVIGPALAAGVVAGAAWAAERLQIWPFWQAALVAASMVAVIAVAFGVWTERTQGTWGIAVRRRPWSRWVAATVMATLSVPLLSLACWAPLWPLTFDASADGRTALVATDSGRLWTWNDGKWTRLAAVAKGGRFSLGPNGAHAVWPEADFTVVWRRRGAETRCPVESAEDIQGSSWRSDGGAFAYKTLLVSGSTWRVVGEDGCEDLGTHGDFAFLGTEQVTLDDGTVRVDGRTVGTSFAEVRLIQSGAQVYAIGAKRGKADPECTLHQVMSVALIPLADRAAHVWPVTDGLCWREAESRHCIRQDGTPVQVDPGWSAVATGLWIDDFIVRTADGSATWSRRDLGMAREIRLLDGPILRVFRDDGITDHPPGATVPL